MGYGPEARGDHRSDPQALAPTRRESREPPSRRYPALDCRLYGTAANHPGTGPGRRRRHAAERSHRGSAAAAGLLEATPPIARTGLTNSGYAWTRSFSIANSAASANTDYVICITTKHGRTWRHLKDDTGWTRTGPSGRVHRLSAEQLLSHLLPPLAGDQPGLTVRWNDGRMFLPPRGRVGVGVSLKPMARYSTTGGY